MTDVPPERKVQRYEASVVGLLSMTTRGAIKLCVDRKDNVALNLQTLQMDDALFSDSNQCAARLN